MAFEKGQSGNPGGRPKEKPFRDALRQELAALGNDDPKSLRSLARRLLEKASAGDDSMAAIKEVADRLDGKPAQAVIGDEDENPINILHRIERIVVRPPDTNG
jgi:hypothetical protein